MREGRRVKTHHIFMGMTVQEIFHGQTLNSSWVLPAAKETPRERERERERDDERERERERKIGGE